MPRQGPQRPGTNREPDKREGTRERTPPQTRPRGAAVWRRGRSFGTIGRYLPRWRACLVLFSIFLCFFLRMRLRRFLISDPMRVDRLANVGNLR